MPTAPDAGFSTCKSKQESPAVADKPARRKSMPKLLQFDVLTCTTLSLTILVHRLAVGPSEICEIPRNSLKIQTYRDQGHPRSSILVPIESAYVLSY